MMMILMMILMVIINFYLLYNNHNGNNNDQKFEFTDNEVTDYISKGLKIEKAEVDRNLFLRDLLESVCILQKEGMHYTFTHRSFFLNTCIISAIASSFLPFAIESETQVFK